MTCKNRPIRDVLPEYAVGCLPLESMRQIREHLEACAECRDELAVITLMANDSEPEPPQGFWMSLPDNVTLTIEENRKRFFHLPLPVWAGGVAAAALLIAVIIGPWKAQKMEAELPGAYYVQMTEQFNLGLEEEILSVSGLQVADLERSLEQEISLSGDLDSADPLDDVFQPDLYEGMNDITIRAFEKLIEDMAPIS